MRLRKRLACSIPRILGDTGDTHAVDGDTGDTHAVDGDTHAVDGDTRDGGDFGGEEAILLFADVRT
jgi:hypothetical protein